MKYTVNNLKRRRTTTMVSSLKDGKAETKVYATFEYRGYQFAVTQALGNTSKKTITEARTGMTAYPATKASVEWLVAALERRFELYPHEQFCATIDNAPSLDSVTICA